VSFVRNFLVAALESNYSKDRALTTCKS